MVEKEAGKTARGKESLLESKKTKGGDNGEMGEAFHFNHAFKCFIPIS